jgi:CubicO group peptidase (beta-lactamase class C family)
MVLIKKTYRARACIIFLSLLVTGCMTDEEAKHTYSGYTPQAAETYITTGDAAANNIDTAQLDAAYRLIYREDRFIMARSLLVFRNGSLIAEAYPHDSSDISNLANIQSSTKSVTSILTGIAVHENKLSVSTPLYSIYPQYFDGDTKKQTITIADALTMRTGLTFDNDSQTGELYACTGNSAAYVLSQNRIYDPGTVMNYNDGAPQLVAKAIEVSTGENLADYAQEKLFTPLAITNWKWERAHDGTPFGAFSLYLRPRDLGKIGLLLLNNGIWEGSTIIDSSYLTEATTVQTADNYHNSPYGYFFWVRTAYNGYSIEGHGGQFVLIVPTKNLVVVYTAWPYTSSLLFDQESELMQLISNSCK